MFSCTWVRLLNVPDGSRGFIELSEMDTKTHHGKERRHLCAFLGKENGFSERQELSQKKGVSVYF